MSRGDRFLDPESRNLSPQRMENNMENEKFDKCMYRIRSGDKNALKEIYEEYNDYIFHLLLSLIGNYQDAEDITVEFFIKLWDQSDRFVPGGGHKRWMTVIARNMALDFLRSRGREIPVEPQDVGTQIDADPQIEKGYDEVIEDMSVAKALDSLTPAEREVVHMKVIGDLTFRNIADILKIPMGTVTWRYRQAVSKLRRGGYEAL